MFIVTCISVVQYHHDADELSKQKVALKILGRCFAVRSGKDMLNYMYQEYDVSSEQCYSIIIILWSTRYYYTLQETTSMETILHETYRYPAPRMILISSMAKVQYFVTAENDVLGEYPSLQDMLFYVCLILCVSPA